MFLRQRDDHLYTGRLFVPIAVESVAIRVSLPRFSNQESGRPEALTGSPERGAAARGVDGWKEPHQEFHRGLIARASERVTQLAGRTQESAKRYRRMYVTQGLRACWHTTTEHTAILGACEDRDRSAAAGELTRHYARTALTIIALRDPRHDPASVRAAVALASPSQPKPQAGSNSNDAGGLRALTREPDDASA
jgi:DNA-binding GntR family transcriptional regulator